MSKQTRRALAPTDERTDGSAGKRSHLHMTVYAIACIRQAYQVWRIVIGGTKMRGLNLRAFPPAIEWNEIAICRVVVWFRCPEPRALRRNFKAQVVKPTGKRLIPCV